VLVAISQPVSFEVIEKHTLTSFDRLPGIIAAAMRMNTPVRDAKGSFAIDENVR